MSCIMYDAPAHKLIAAMAIVGPHGTRSNVFMENANDVLRTVYLANLDAYEDRYPSEEGKELRDMIPVFVNSFEVFEYAQHGAKNPVAALKNVQGYQYQACDWRDWAGSEAWKISEHAKYTAISHLPEYDRFSIESTWKPNARRTANVVSLTEMMGGKK